MIQSPGWEIHHHINRVGRNSLPAASAALALSSGATAAGLIVSGDFAITIIIYDGVVSSSEPGDYVEIRKCDHVPMQLQDWTSPDSAAHIFTFPDHEMPPDDVCRTCTNEYHPESCYSLMVAGLHLEQYWGCCKIEGRKWDFD